MKNANKVSPKLQPNIFPEEIHQKAKLVIKKLLDTPHKSHQEIKEQRKRIAKN